MGKFVNFDVFQTKILDGFDGDWVLYFLPQGGMEFIS